MPAFHHIDHKSKLIVTYWKGDATDNGFLTAIENYVKNIKNKETLYSYNEIADFSCVKSIQLTPRGLKKVIEVVKKTDVPNTKLALVVSSKMAFAFAKMYKLYRSMISKQYKEVGVFETEIEAFAWVRQKQDILENEING